MFGESDFTDGSSMEPAQKTCTVFLKFFLLQSLIVGSRKVADHSRMF